VSLTIRHATPSDYDRVIGQVDSWWGGRAMAPMLPKLFFVHFGATSYVVEDDAGSLIAFLTGFLSQTHPTEAYIHFIGVAPEHRGSGLGRRLYERFKEDVRGQGRTVVRAVTSLTNTQSIGFHQSLGFEIDGIAANYDGPGEDRVLLVLRLDGR
jgi:ribosomal protein S18 acetylase RimI-like enzyme